MEPAIAPTVTASSVMLAAYGFSYNALRGRIDAASDIGDRGGNEDAVKKQRKTVTRGARTAGLLAGIALVVWLVLMKPAVNEVEAAIRVHFSFAHYSTLDIMFVLLTIAWFGIAIGLTVKTISLIKALKNYAP